MVSSASHGLQSPTAVWSHSASSFDVPLFSIGAPSGMAPAMNTKMRESIERWAWLGVRQPARTMATAPPALSD